MALLLAAAGLKAQNVDINLLKRVNGLDGGFARGYSKAVSATAPYIALGVPVLMGLHGLVDKDEKALADAVYIGTSVVEATAICYALKYVVGRDRPYVRYRGEVVQRDYPESPSFPSGHTAAAFSLATSLSIRYPKWYVIAPSALWACSVGFARMNQGVHYPSDVLCGAVIGSGCAVANIYINRGLRRLFLPKPKPALVRY